jgi:hypothetical protein
MDARVRGSSCFAKNDPRPLAGTNTGAAHPVSLTGGKIDDVMKKDRQRRFRLHPFRGETWAKCLAGGKG